MKLCQKNASPSYRKYVPKMRRNQNPIDSQVRNRWSESITKMCESFLRKQVILFYRDHGTSRTFVIA